MDESTKKRILSKAQNEGDDPGKLNNYRLACGFSYAIGAIVCVCSFLLRLFLKGKFIADAPMAILAMCSFFHWMSYIKNEKKPRDLCCAIFMSLLFLILVIVYFYQL